MTNWKPATITTEEKELLLKAATILKREGFEETAKIISIDVEDCVLRTSERAPKNNIDDIIGEARSFVDSFFNLDRITKEIKSERRDK